MSPVLKLGPRAPARQTYLCNRPVEPVDIVFGGVQCRVFRFLDVLSDGTRAGCAAMSLFLLFVWLEARQQQFPGKGRVRRARALAELVRSGRLTLGVP